MSDPNLVVECELPDISDNESAASTNDDDSEIENDTNCNSDEEDRPREWVLATSTSDHMTGEFCAFLPGTYLPFKPTETRKVQLFGGKVLEAIGKGEVFLDIKNNSHGHNFIVLFVPALESKGGYISLGKLSDDDFVVKFSNKGAMTIKCPRGNTGTDCMKAAKINSRYIFRASRDELYYRLDANEHEALYTARNSRGPYVPPLKHYEKYSKHIARTAPFSTDPGDTEPSDSESDYGESSDEDCDMASISSDVSENIIKASGEMSLDEWKFRLERMMNYQLKALSQETDWARWERNFMRRVKREMRKLPIERNQEMGDSGTKDENGEDEQNRTRIEDGSSIMGAIKIELPEADLTIQFPDTPQSAGRKRTRV